MSVPSRVIVDYAQTGIFSVFCHKIDCISMFFVYSKSQRAKLHDWFKSNSNFNDIVFLNAFLLPLKKVESQINKLPKGSIGKSNLWRLVSDIAIFAQNW